MAVELGFQPSFAMESLTYAGQRNLTFQRRLPFAHYGKRMFNASSQIWSDLSQLRTNF